MKKSAGKKSHATKLRKYGKKGLSEIAKRAARTRRRKATKATKTKKSSCIKYFNLIIILLANL